MYKYSSIWIGNSGPWCRAAGLTYSWETTSNRKARRLHRICDGMRSVGDKRLLCHCRCHKRQVKRLLKRKARKAHGNGN